MKKIKLLILGIILTFIVNGQDKKLSIGIVVSPDFYNYDFNRIAGFDHHYKTKINYSAGLGLQYIFTKKFSLKTRLLYSTKGYILNYAWIVIDPTDPAIPEKSNLKVSYIDVPLMINYNFINRTKISLFSSAGFVTGFLISKKEVSIMADGTEKESNFLNQKLKSNILAIEFDLGLKFNFNKKLYITIEPYFRYGLNKIDEKVIISNPISFGTLIGFHYNLK